MRIKVASEWRAAALSPLGSSLLARTETINPANMAAQRVRALFLSFKNSPCETIITTGLKLSKKNGWATQAYCIDGIDTNDGHCKWLLERVIQDTVATAEREQAQLLVFYGGYGTSSAGNEEAVLHGSVTGEAGIGYNSSFNLFYLLSELSKPGQNCLLVLHTSIAAEQLAIWREEDLRDSKSTRNLQVLLFHEDQSLIVTYVEDEQGNTMKGDQGVDLIDVCQNVPFQQLEKVEDALSDMIKTCYFGKLQLNHLFRQKLNDKGLQYTALFNDDTAASFVLESPGGDKATASASIEEYRNVSVFLLAFDVPGWPRYDPQMRLEDPRLRLEILSSVSKKCYDFDVQLFHPEFEIGRSTTEWVTENLQSHIDKHNHADGLLIFCYSGEARTSQSSNNILALPYDNCPDSFNMTESKAKDRVFELITSNNRETLFERVIGRLINRAGSSFTISDLKHDLQDVDPNSARGSRPRRSTAGPRLGKAIPPKK
ncbi:hypothetical protein HII31_08731 [Pseudocercospora fuligena]|uniref:Uncharacterized protein n=1 Tax=Pseudocercospora fuligena TaxID=685502 RepID=A0A8H6RE40_9PEZI|nr:hypothetical protein HII31_08731 [Pseudocercospora fuligena]